MAQSAGTGSGAAGRTLFALVGAGLIILGGVKEWVKGIPGTELSAQMLTKHAVRHADTLITSIGFLAIVLGLAAILGLATGGWLTRLAGALGIVMFVLLVVQLYAGGPALLPGLGPWLVLVGGIVAVAGGG
jgi:hypothetical protein